MKPAEIELTPQQQQEKNARAIEDAKLYQQQEAARAEIAKTKFQDAVYDAFGKGGTKANSQDRAKLRDNLADAVLPKWLATALNDGREQLDGAEFVTHFLDAILPEGNKIEEKSTLKWGEGAAHQESEKVEKQTKLELPFEEKKGSTIKCSEMLVAYSQPEKLDENNKFAAAKGADTAKTISCAVGDPNVDIVVSLRRFKATKTGRQIVGDSGNMVDETRQSRINDPVELDPIELSTKNGTKQKYEPTSFIVHREGINGGHYVAYVKEVSNGKVVWACYDDSSPSELDGSKLPAEAAQAYTVKYSPIADDAKNDATRYKSGLPDSQGAGTINGGNRCWANAGFAFALSIKSLHQAGHKRSEKTEAEKKAEAFKKKLKTTPTAGNPSDVSHLVWLVMDCDGSEDLKKAIELLNDLEKNNKRADVDSALAGMGLALTNQMFINVAENYLYKLFSGQSNKKADEILGLVEYFSDEKNKANVLKIVEGIQTDKNNFLADPKEFCANIISPSATDKNAAKTQLEPKKQMVVTTEYLKKQIDAKHKSPSPKTPSPSPQPIIFAEADKQAIVQYLAEKKAGNDSMASDPVIKKFKECLEKQEENPQPNGAYNGIGARFKVIEVGDQYALEVQSTFIKPHALSTGNLVSEIEVEGKRLNVNTVLRTHGMDGLKTLAQAFHSEEKSKKFTVEKQGSNPPSQQTVECPTDVFITDKCEVVKDKFKTKGIAGELFNPKEHGTRPLEVVAQSESSKGSISRM
jgi:Ubiquitin carboxyl-terminal hydrolase